MNRYILKTSLMLVLSACILLTSCDDGDDTVVVKSVLVVNAGNFGKANGSISSYDEEKKTITNFAVKKANGGTTDDEIGSSVESMYIHNGTGYILCNAIDKIERVNAETLEYLGAANDDFVNPRYMAAKGDKAYVACWGAWGAGYTLPDSYIAVVNLNTFEIDDFKDTPSGPEGIYIKDSKLFVANSYTTMVSVYNLADMSLEKTIDVKAAPQHFVEDKDGNIWVSLGSSYGKYAEVGLRKIYSSSLALGDLVSIPGIGGDGEIATNKAKDKIYVLGAEPYPGTSTEVLEFDVVSNEVADAALVTGEGFYGIGFNAATNKLYVAIGGFASTGKVKVYNTDGTLYDEQEASVGTFHFAFK